ncbi:STAS domain-containing protein [Tautonia sociabilis]|uniref:Anti-sigma factor antagonist n=1 Tax=Tautonia sociabilis TaxID=2080755 RepID=A0A432MIP4_9BACT|nr:STAS domain-containing protein [Tautonia sociabilis]RUL87075.1 anti-sigma factor antagonist [Tautonia sociabilis]
MSDPNEPQFVAEDVDAATVARITAKEIRHPEAATALGAQLKGLVEQHSRTRIVVDLDSCRYISSTGFAALLGLGRLLRQHGGRMALCRVDPDVLVGARIIGIEQVAPIFETESQAIAHVSA